MNWGSASPLLKAVIVLIALAISMLPATLYALYRQSHLSMETHSASGEVIVTLDCDDDGKCSVVRIRPATEKYGI